VIIKTQPPVLLKKSVDAPLITAAIALWMIFDTR
jgi:hypothetical protein